MSNNSYYIRLAMVNDHQYREFIESINPPDSPLRQPFTAAEIGAATNRTVTEEEAVTFNANLATTNAALTAPGPLPQDIIEAFKAGRRQQRLSQAELAKKAGMSQSSLARIEEGKVAPGLHILQRLAEALDLQLTLQPRQR